MNRLWKEIARRAVQGLDVHPGELIQVRDHAGRPGVLQEMLFAIEAAGATPLPEITPPDYLRQLLNEVDHRWLEQWDQHRSEWMERVDRILVLQGTGLDVEEVPVTSLDAWGQAVHRLTLIEEERRLPYMLVAVPTEDRARHLGVTKQELDERVLPALSASVDELRQEINRVLGAVKGGQRLTIRSGNGHELHLSLGRRRWLADDGYIEAEERLQGAIVSNLPAGSVYTTVVEQETYGSVWLPRASGATDVVLRFEQGCVTEVNAADHADAFTGLLERHTGDCGRVGHIGIGLNPYLNAPLGDWTIVNEHVHGTLFISLGENRYMGGKNESSLNVDYALREGTLLVDDRVIVEAGKVVI